MNRQLVFGLASPIIGRPGGSLRSQDRLSEVCASPHPSSPGVDSTSGGTSGFLWPVPHLPVTVFHAASNISLMSSQGLTFLIYSRSYRRRRLGAQWRGRYNCATPVNPGVIPRRSGNLGSSIVDSSCISTGRALGPTKLISPFTMFTTCGSSSRAVRRRTRPTMVIRGSSSLVIGPAASAPSTMVRNFKKVNSRPSLPTRFCLKNTGPLSSSQIARGTKIHRPSHTGISNGNRWAVVSMDRSSGRL